ncbi:MAG: hypothetical protein ACLUIQ_07255 [Dialister invisus]
MVMLVQDALLEMKKVLDYTGDVAANYMKMEARCRKIYVLRNGEMNFIGKKSAVFLRKNNLLPIDLLERYSGGYGKDAGCGCRPNTPAKTFVRV